MDHALLVGDSLMSVKVVGKCPKKEVSRFRAAFGSKSHNLVYGDIAPDFFMFNNPESACRTCGGIGRDKATHPDLLIPDPQLSLRDGCFVREAFRYNPDNWMGYMLYGLTQAYDLDLDTPWRDLGDDVRQVVLYGAEKRTRMQKPPNAKVDKKNWIGREVHWPGIASRIERSYRRYRQMDVANSGMEAWLDRVMVEHECRECRGTRLRPTRLKFAVAGKNIHDFGMLHFDELKPFLGTIRLKRKNATAGDQIIREMDKRLDLLLGIGLDYLNFNRPSGTLSGGEAQRIRLSTQIGSGLMGMLYVLDEPSIGLHPKDNAKMIATLKSLRDIGNTVVVVEHDEATIREADYIVEMGPGPGLHGGEVVVQGKLADLLKCKHSPTGQYLSGARRIETPVSRRSPTGKSLVVRGARENNLKDIDVDFPLGLFVCITGASGSGKSTLVKEILYKRLWKERIDSRTLPGDHDDVEGMEHITAVVNIDQSPIGRNSRSNPATYIGFYDNIRSLFAETEISKNRGYKPGQFSFNKKGGRCEECQGEGTIRTKLYFMPDVEVVCATCKGKRYNAETLEVTFEGKTIADILDTSIEEGVEFFADVSTVGRKIAVLDDLGLGYLTLGQSATTLSGGEAQRIKLATELSKLQRRNHILYILDEPTTGLHLADISRLLECLQRLVDAGHTVLVIEHHLDVIKSADYVIDLGPEGGRHGGEVVAAGPPEKIASCRASHTGRYLKPYLSGA